MKFRWMAAACAVMIAGVASAQDAVQWRVEDGGNGHWYVALPSVAGRDWEGWVVAASALGGHLATITSVAENVFVTGPSVFPNAYPTLLARIGASQPAGSAEPLGGWQWITGERFELRVEQWTSLEDCCGGNYCNFDGEDSAGVFTWADGSPERGLGGGWNDIGKCLDWWGAVVEWSADCDGDGIVDYGQILTGQLADTNTNGVPDCCEQGTNCTPCYGDITGNGVFDGVDLAALLAACSGGKSQFDCDIDNDGIVGGGDLAFVLAGWGACPCRA